jgi:hypothetical protein
MDHRYLTVDQLYDDGQTQKRKPCTVRSSSREEKWNDARSTYVGAEGPRWGTHNLGMDKFLGKLGSHPVSWGRFPSCPRSQQRPPLAQGGARQLAGRLSCVAEAGAGAVGRWSLACCTVDRCVLLLYMCYVCSALLCIEFARVEHRTQFNLNEVWLAALHVAVRGLSL